jgi:hypothetical protein
MLLSNSMGLLVQAGQRESGRCYPQHFIFAVHKEYFYRTWFHVSPLTEEVFRLRAENIAPSMQ